MSGAYYNDNDPFNVAWLKELITAGIIAPGEIDERSIEEVKPDDLRGFTQCHFFAGVGVWSYALRLAGWPDNKPVWTGSCPCPPFSSVGVKKACPQCEGTNPVPHVGRTGYFVCCLCDYEWLADARHLWPELWRLVSVCRPVTLFGEQVAGDDGKTWLTLVRASLEILGYAVGAKDLCSAGFGASDIRQRLFFVADTRDSERGGRPESQRNQQRRILHASDSREVGDMAHTKRKQFRAGRSRGAEYPQAEMQGADGQRGRIRDDTRERSAVSVLGQSHSTGSQPRNEAGTTNGHGNPAIAASGLGLLEHTAIVGHSQRPSEASAQPERTSSRTTQQRLGETGELGDPNIKGPQRHGRLVQQHDPQGWEIQAGCITAAGGVIELAHADSLEPRDGELQRSRRLLQPEENPLAGFWANAEWIYCQDEKWRPVEPGSFPLVNGAPNRVGRLRGYGNAINAQVAKGFIEAYMSL